MQTQRPPVHAYSPSQQQYDRFGSSSYQITPSTSSFQHLDSNYISKSLILSSRSRLAITLVLDFIVLYCSIDKFELLVIHVHILCICAVGVQQAGVDRDVFFFRGLVVFGEGVSSDRVVR